MNENTIELGKERMKWRIHGRFLRRMFFGMVAAAALLWFVVRIEDINHLRGIDSSRATGLSYVPDRIFNTPMLMKATAQQIKVDQATAGRPGPLIARAVSLNVSVRNFAETRSKVEQIVNANAGYVASMTISSPKDASQSLSANIAIPSAQSDAAVGEVRALGRVEEERQSAEEVTSQSEDLDIRLKNAREAESRLSGILRMGTGKVSDVLEVEKEMARVREEIERMESGQKHLSNRVAFVSIDVNVTEEYQAQFGRSSSPVRLQIRNALVSGYQSAEDGFLDAFAFLLSAAPSLLLWGLIFFMPARWVWRRWQQSQANGAVKT